MIKWTPITPNPLNLDKIQSQKYYQKRILSLISVAVLGGVLAFYLPSNSIPAIATIILTVLLFIGLYLHWRQFFFSYWHINNVDRFYYEDYSWKDSLSIALILITGLALSGLIMFFIIARVNFTKVQPIVIWLKQLI